MGLLSGRALCAACFSLLFGAPGVAAAAQDEPTAARETFVVELFKNAAGFRALD
jgi:hypothetical protein